jgi:CRP/FNR family cyclic AMP-dependent transcriptional regulator
MIKTGDRSGMIQAREKSFLKSVGILGDLTDDELEQVWKIVTRIEVPRDSVIMREGEIGDTMYFFAEGEVEVTQRLTLRTGRHGFSQAEKSVVKLDARSVSFFGDMAMLETEPRSATITTSTDCVLYEVRRDDFEILCSLSPSLGYKIIKRIAMVLCQRLRRGNQDVLKLTTALSLALAK